MKVREQAAWYTLATKAFTSALITDMNNVDTNATIITL